jgi:hypothetical protein
MEYSPKSPWYFATLAIVFFLEAGRIAFLESHMSRPAVAWWTAAGFLSLLGAGLAWQRARRATGRQPDHTA